MSDRPLDRLAEEAKRKYKQRRNLLFLEAAVSCFYEDMEHEEVIEFLEGYINQLKEIPI